MSNLEEAKTQVRALVTKAISQSFLESLGNNEGELVKELMRITNTVVPELSVFDPLSFKEELKACLSRGLPVRIYNSRDNRVTKSAQIDASPDLRNWELRVREDPSIPWNEEFVSLCRNVRCSISSIGGHYNSGYNAICLETKNSKGEKARISFCPGSILNVSPSHLPDYFQVFSHLYMEFHKEFYEHGITNVSRREKRLELVVKMLNEIIGKKYIRTSKTGEKRLVSGRMLSDSNVSIDIGNPDFYSSIISIHRSLEDVEEHVEEIGKNIMLILGLGLENWEINTVNTHRSNQYELAENQNEV